MLTDIQDGSAFAGALDEARREWHEDAFNGRERSLMALGFRLGWQARETQGEAK